MGRFAQRKGKLIDASKHTIIKIAHPSPLAFKKFINSRCFSNTNKALVDFGKTPIDWALSKYKIQVCGYFKTVR